MRRCLRPVRVGAAAVVILLFALVLLGPSPVQAALAGWWPHLQAGPALGRLVAGCGLGAAVVLLIIGAVTVLAGRVYCAVWCPLGILQDGMRFMARRVPWLRRGQDRDPRPGWLRWRRRIRWSVLTATVVAACLGAGVLAAGLEPYSLWGRVVTHAVGPLVRLAQDALAAGLERLDIYALSASQVAWPTPATIGLAGALLLLLALSAALGGRWYCTTVCPVGTALGLLAQAAPVRVRVDPGRCTRCGLCVRRCRAGSLHLEDGVVQADPSTCIACMDCQALCPAGAIHYGLPAGPSSGTVGPRRVSGRRELIAAGSAAAVAALAQPLRLAVNERPVESDLGPVSPPGSGSRVRFLESCTACQLCVTACPAQVLQPAFLEYGATGILQPRLSFKDGFCEYDCNRCTTVCPTGALRPLDLAEKQRTQLGVACLHKTRCIVYCRGEECGACAEVCPTHAVYTREQDGLLCPETAPGSCIGCGACEYACPQSPKAIEVQACAIHGVAAKPHVPQASPEPLAPAPAPAAFPF